MDFSWLLLVEFIPLAEEFDLIVDIGECVILKSILSYLKRCIKNCSTIVNLALNLDLSIVAEGVEHKSQVDFLVKHGCSIFQEFYFYKPMPALDITPLLES